MRSTTPLALAVAVLALGTSSVVGAAPSHTARVPRPARAPVLPRPVETYGEPPLRLEPLEMRPGGGGELAAPAPAAWARGLGAIEVLNRNTRSSAKVRLYDDAGRVDVEAARTFMRTAATEKDKDEPLPTRLVQLAVRASYHFGGATIVVVSATRAGAKGKHGTGEALDFQLEGVKASALAAYLFTQPLVGVGLYTHPKTQFVHLDVRDRSTHWLDASPPKVTWREKLLADPKAPVRDAAYAPTSDLPEVAATSGPATHVAAR